MTKKRGNPIPGSIRFAALAVDAVCFRVRAEQLEILVGKVVSKGNVFEGQWAHIGGLIRVDETADQSVSRLLKDKAGIKDIYKEQLYTFSEIDRDPRGRVVSVAYLALTSDVSELGETGVPTQWISLHHAPDLAYDHNLITKIARERLQNKLMYTDIARHLMPEDFTLSDLQKTYEVVLGDKLDKRNFRKRILALDQLEETGEVAKRGVMRPAALYRFK